MVNLRDHPLEGWDKNVIAHLQMEVKAAFQKTSGLFPRTMLSTKRTKLAITALCLLAR